MAVQQWDESTYAPSTLEDCLDRAIETAVE